MVMISKKIEYGLLVLSYLFKRSRREDDLVSLKLVSKDLDLPYRYLCKLAAEMKNGGFLESKEGRVGGYKVVDLERFSLYDLFCSLEEERNLVECLCKDGKCKMMGICGKSKIVWRKLWNKFLDEMKKIKLTEMMG